MVILFALPALIYFFFFLELSILIKGIAVAFCAFQWIANRKAVITSIEKAPNDPAYENAHRNPIVVFFMTVGMLGTVVGGISILVDAFKLVSS